MMMMDDAKKKASMIVVGIGGEPKGDSEVSEMQLEAAQEMMDASKEDDVEGYAYALKTFLMLCEQSEED